MEFMCLYRKPRKPRVLPFFKECPPKPEKLAAKELLYAMNMEDPRDVLKVVVDRDGWLVDGYANYLVMASHGKANCVTDILDERVYPEVRARGRDGKVRYVRVSMRTASRLRFGKQFIVCYDGRLIVLAAELMNVRPGAGAPKRPVPAAVLPGRAITAT